VAGSNLVQGEMANGVRRYLGRKTGFINRLEERRVIGRQPITQHGSLEGSCR
jgi:hypothetical protein